MYLSLHFGFHSSRVTYPYVTSFRLGQSPSTLFRPNSILHYKLRTNPLLTLYPKDPVSFSGVFVGLSSVVFGKTLIVWHCSLLSFYLPRSLFSIQPKALIYSHTTWSLISHTSSCTSLKSKPFYWRYYYPTNLTTPSPTSILKIYPLSECLVHDTSSWFCLSSLSTFSKLPFNWQCFTLLLF